MAYRMQMLQVSAASRAESASENGGYATPVGPDDPDSRVAFAVESLTLNPVG
jgi:hypothetical protein